MILPEQLTLEYLSREYQKDRFSDSALSAPEQKIRVVDPSDGKVWGFLIIDDTRRGPGLGGIRAAPDLSLNEVGRLARSMTLKNSAANIPFGGGKSGIVANPIFLRQNPSVKEKFIKLFAEAIFPEERYIPAPDMGTDEQDMQAIFDFYSEKLNRTDHMRGGSGRPPDRGGIPLDEWGLTAQGLYAATETLQKLDGRFQIKGSRVVIQGYGNVGSPTADKLHRAGAMIVGASDIHAALWNPDGLNIEKLNRIRREPGGLQDYTGSVKKKFDSNRLDWLLEAPCDILVPAARPDAITSRNVDRIQCKVILQGANTPVNKMTEYYLKNRKNILSLSDFIVNVGGVIGCAVELKMASDSTYKKKVSREGTRQYLDALIYETISRNVEEIFKRLKDSKNQDTIFREEALRLAEERLASNNPEIWL